MSTWIGIGSGFDATFRFSEGQAQVLGFVNLFFHTLMFLKLVEIKILKASQLATGLLHLI